MLGQQRTWMKRYSVTIWLVMTPKCDVPAGEGDELSAWHTLALSKCVLTASVAPCREGCAADLCSFIISPSFVRRPRAPHSHWCSSSAPHLCLSMVSFSPNTDPTLLSPSLDLYYLSTFPSPSPDTLLFVLHCFPLHQCFPISCSFTVSLFQPLFPSPPHTPNFSLSLSLSLYHSLCPHTHTHTRSTHRSTFQGWGWDWKVVPACSVLADNEWACQIWCMWTARENG